MASSVFDVQKSLKDLRWRFADVDEDEIVRLVQNHELPEFVARLLVQRGVKTAELQSFLYPSLKNDFPDPFSFAGMDEFADELAERIINKQPVGIFADFDVDGSTSAAILTRFLKHFGIDPPVYIPDRLVEGYGPNVEAMQSLKDQGAEFVIMADCGTTAFEPLQAAHDMGLRVAVFDHHEAEEKLPTVAHLINPKRKDDTSGLDMLAACGVSFLACVAINNKLRQKGFFDAGKGNVEAPLKSWLDLVALGTVCDMVPLKGVNRLFVRSGFDQMAALGNPGIRALCAVGKVDDAPTPKDAGWSLGPRINAGSRVHRSDLGAKLLSTDDNEEAQSIAFALEDCNVERRKIQSDMLKVAEAQIELKNLERHAAIVVDDASFHSGLSGLASGRIKEKYNKPAVVITYVENADGVLEGRGSGRSIKGANIAQAFIDARNDGLLLKGGGHAMAGGFTLEPEKLEEFRAYFCAHIEKQLKDVPAVQEMDIDGVATVRGAKPEFIKILTQHVGPFGMGNPEPVFALADVRVHSVDVLKEKHIRLLVSDSEGGTRMKCMMFSGVDTELGKMLLTKYKTTPFHLVGQFQINNWQGRESVEFHLIDGVNSIAMESEQLAG